MTYAEYIALAKDFIISAAAITGAFVAIRGLGTWQKQLKGHSEYDLSRRLLVSLFKYRNALYNVRHPAMFSYEMPTPPDSEAREMSPEQIQFYGTSNAYQARWVKVESERTNLYADLLEAKALWGDEPERQFKVIYDLEHELYTCVRHYIILINPQTAEAKKNAILKSDEMRRDILYDDLSEDGDEFKKEFEAGIESIENYLKPKLT